MSDTALVRSGSTLLVEASSAAATGVANAGPDIVYYKTTNNVSSSDTALASGANVSLTGPMFFTSAGASLLTIQFSGSATAPASVPADAARISVLEAAPVHLESHGFVIDGVTDNTSLWDGFMPTLPDGTAVTWTGNLVVQPGRTQVGRVALLGQGRRTALTFAGGTTTNDGLTIGGTDGLRYFHAIRNVDILGGASCCRRALVLLNLIDPDVDVHVKAGATDYAISIEGVQNAKLLKATVSNNSSLAYAGTAPANGVRIVGSARIPTNANVFDLNVEALAGVGIFADGSVGAAGDYNNTLRGVSQGNGTNLDVRHWKNACLTDLHLEAATVDAELVSCQGVHIGPRVFVDGNLNLVTCDRVTVDGFSIRNAGGTATLTVENDTTNTRLGDVDYDVLTDSAPSTIYPVGFRKIASKTWDPASIADGAETSTTLTVTGALVGDVVSVGFTPAVPAGALLVGAVTAANTVTVTLLNKTGGVLDLASGTVKALVAR